MKYEIVYKPSYSLLKVELEQGEIISAEAGAMVSMSSGIQIETKAKGGIFSPDSFLAWLIPQIPQKG